MPALRIVGAEQNAGDLTTCSAGNLMDRLRQGERRALDELIRRFWHKLIRYAAQIVGNVDDAQDVVQETFVAAWKHRERWIAASSTAAYLFRITRNNAYNHLRKAASEDRSRAKLASITPPSSSEQNHELRLVHAAAEAVAALPQRRREVFLLARAHGLTYQEIAATMEISVQTVANHMTAALTQLRKDLCSKL